jgi:uncharacterized protein YbcV (DUF1398 family)
MFRHSTGMHLLPRSGPIKPETAAFRSSLAASWRAGGVRYEADFAARKVMYYGCNGDEYIEDNPAVDVD